jgi:hypothetical protein
VLPELNEIGASPLFKITDEVGSGGYAISGDATAGDIKMFNF